ncbi:hypothetical protein [Blochmannia endosymbiont of Camponotus modoc]|uniref:hypothetical protein n=1 Tax=Blochmannia endosymbiont of Camponotus modoc TaxID=2945587 RepID=UPI002024A906|nr:hypothetical protein [Blochmannia endosymbiont of Camponotus modoc]URJ29507.1 hypothetical protein M9398_00850 [Blochmannia endosymbiont of Camponotus modoc]
MIELTPLGVKENKYNPHNCNLQCAVPCSSRISLLVFRVWFWFGVCFSTLLIKKFLGIGRCGDGIELPS